MRARYAALFGFVVLMSIVHAMVAFWTPVQGEAWDHWIWAAQHRDDATGTWLASFLRTHFTFSDAIGYAVSRCRIFHVLVTPMVVIALVTGLFTLAMRRLPRATWDDILGLALVSALLWIGQPSAGVTLFHLPNVALYLYGSTVAVWVIAPLRCGWQVSARWWPLLILGAYCAGTSSRAIATATLVGFALVMWRRPRVRWMWITLGVLFVATVVGYLDPPWFEVQRVVRRGFEQNLIGRGLIKYLVGETGEIISLVATFVLLDIVLGVIGRARAPVDQRPDPHDTLTWFAAWLLIAIWCLFGPKYTEAAALPATCMLVVGALPYLVWFAHARWLRYALVAFAIGVHVIAWTMAVLVYARVGAQGQARLAAFEHAKPGSAAFVAPYSRVASDFWFFGEDLDTVRTRMLVATEAFGIADIVIEPPFRKLERNPNVALRLETEGLSAEQLAAARVPLWASEASAARTQFGTFVKRLRRVTNKPFTARLVVTNLAFGETRGRPIYAAWVDDTGTMIPRIVRSPADSMSRFTIRVYGRDARYFKEAWWVQGGTATSIPFRFSNAIVQPMTSHLHVVVLCSPERCLIGDAFLPRF